MEAEELGGSWVISVDELGAAGLWTTIKDVSGSCVGCVCLALVARYTLRCARWHGAHSRALRAAILHLQRAPLRLPKHTVAHQCGLRQAARSRCAAPHRPRAAPQLLEARAPLRGLMLSNKFGRPSQVASLPLTWVPRRMLCA